MRKVLRKLLEILDGTPAEHGHKRQRGQSVLELALVSPLIIIMLAGMVEIGWLARNYLELLEVTRVGARFAAQQDGETSPLNWDDRGSVPPDPSTPSYDTALAVWELAYRNCDFSVGSPAEYGFFNFVSCIMQRSMDVLPFRKGNDDEGVPFPDDIVISVFAVQSIDPEAVTTFDSTYGTGFLGLIDWPAAHPERVSGSMSVSDPQGVVVGRYPANANECHYEADGTVMTSPERDPFDFARNNLRDPDPRGTIPFIELAGMDINSPGDAPYERYLGFSWFGQHQISDNGCIGSEWSLAEVERLVNLQNFGLVGSVPVTGLGSAGRDQRDFVPTQAIVLVEMFWRHDTLSQFIGLAPVISPVFAALGLDTNLSTWAVFPVPAAAPNINFEN